MTITIEKRMSYWRSVAGRAFDSRLAAGHIDELRAALRDAIHQIEEDRHRHAHLETKKFNKMYAPKGFHLRVPAVPGMEVMDAE